MLDTRTIFCRSYGIQSHASYAFNSLSEIIRSFGAVLVYRPHTVKGQSILGHLQSRIQIPADRSLPARALKLGSQ